MSYTVAFFVVHLAQVMRTVLVPTGSMFDFGRSIWREQATHLIVIPPVIMP